MTEEHPQISQGSKLEAAIQPPPSDPRLQPVPERRRIETLDVLRGVALLGILVMNVTGIAFPMAAYFNPMVYGGPAGADYGAWVFAHLADFTFHFGTHFCWFWSTRCYFSF